MIDTLTSFQLFASFSILALAYIIRGMAGFGSGLIAIPLLSLMMPLTVVVPMMVLLDYLVSLAQGIKNRDQILWKELLPLIPFSMVGVVVAILFLPMSDGLLLSKAMGIFIILFALYTLSGFTFRTGVSKAWSGLAGLSGGMIGTLFGTGGPLYVTYFKARGLDKAVFRTTLAVTFLLDGIGLIAGFGSAGYLNMNLLTLLFISLPVMVVFVYIGGHVHTRISQAQFQKAISVLLILSGTVLLLR